MGLFLFSKKNKPFSAFTRFCCGALLHDQRKLRKMGLGIKVLCQQPMLVVSNVLTITHSVVTTETFERVDKWYRKKPCDSHSLLSKWRKRFHVKMLVHWRDGTRHIWGQIIPFYFQALFVTDDTSETCLRSRFCQSCARGGLWEEDATDAGRVHTAFFFLYGTIKLFQVFLDSRKVLRGFRDSPCTTWSARLSPTHPVTFCMSGQSRPTLARDRDQMWRKLWTD